MLLSLNWLREFVPYTGDAQTLADRLTMLGLEVEEIGRPFAALEKIVVGFVAECAAHPSSDHLSVCRVDIGTGELLDIVCGAPNVAAGQKVLVAPVGTVMPGGLEIKKAKLRGQTSCGMICSEREMGLGDNHDGIMVLDAGLAVGTPICEALGLDRTVLDVSITPNRADCLSVLGLAREVAAAFGLPLTVPRTELTEGGEAFENFRIEPDPALCPLYQARLIRGAKIGPSPAWLRYRLIAVGLRPINNIVDVTNYVMLELGQPLHAFDFDLVQGGSIVVREALPDEKITTLDGVERVCPPGSLVIADAGRGIALAGVMGGANSEITGTTRRMFLESANFLRTTVRRTSRRLGLRSEASGRFEKGVDPTGTVRAIERAAELLTQMGAARRVEGIIDVVAETHGPQLITAPVSYLRDLIGIPLDGKEMADLLGQIGITAWLADDPAGSDCSASSIIAEVPTRRLDVEGKADLAEEIARAYGYDRIKPELPTLAMPAASLPPRRQAVQRLRRALLGCGLDELVTFAYHSADEFDRLRLAADHPWRLAMPVLNPMSDEQALMRTSLVPNLLRVAALNAGHGVDGLRAFEVGRAYLPKALPLTELPDEPLRLAVL
ncbi:MAG TPA: phenylalanine--tRNA ligase subunit beta, partial [Desulfomicrobium sp.]|nr:phenylalanine--tRNA ligase subunit beta [Desulfomicrobium sp.]